MTINEFNKTFEYIDIEFKNNVIIRIVGNKSIKNYQCDYPIFTLKEISKIINNKKLFYETIKEKNKKEKIF